MWLWSFFFSLMKIISWNVNSVRARITNILDYIKQSNPDILLLQEIKTQDISFPYEDFQNIRYNSYVFGQKSYNGVAIISKQELDNINKIYVNRGPGSFAGIRNSLSIVKAFNISRKIDYYCYSFNDFKDQKDIKYEDIPSLCDKLKIKKNLIKPIYLS